MACLLFGALIGGITVGVMAAKHKTVRRQPAANSYVVQDSLHLTQQSDLFLYANTTRTARPKDNDRSGSDAHSRLRRLVVRRRRRKVLILIPD